MRTLISHFYNEEYLLPWWLKHHVEMFDQGILIDYSSTDNSIDICRTLAPHWRVVRSRNIQFDAIAIDFEVQQYEAGLPGWKLVLNTTEFLVGVNFPHLEELIKQQQLTGCYFESAVMVDPFPDQVPVHHLPLVEQKFHGYMNTDPANNHGRLYHRGMIGAYMPGRHQSHLPHLAKANGLGTVFWYSMSPWCEPFQRRKLQIKTRLSDHDQRANWGNHHLIDADGLNQKWASQVPNAVDLSHLVRQGL
ncbi:glycosyltransferase family 2 protein [Niveispirillum cyanobacteriorum]|uniref:Uncharacterized protein n=1 Tax=Niveispirillum cyanobacteriorum TaxID=1612173 RepID=A0A2K9N8I2_9PROT|nr:glycosyltransferase family 2 protein [Niveispirillum cyanobacteriorum]AUN29394.1 hypothetical protein C0V82_03435 [Niveispirillum cyanobacteriorum]GGE64492.1 hypothetical protein GCM10011317_22410 [Niveispirillum cyanobacteriorum]